MTAAPGNAGDTDALGSGLSAFLHEQLGAPVTINELRRLSGGASHETWAFDADVAGKPAQSLPLVLRREFAHGLLDSALDTEFALLDALHRAGLPVPRPYWSALRAPGLDTPFMIVERAAGTDLRKVIAARGAGLSRDTLGRTLVALQVRIHQLPWRDQLATTLPPPKAPIAELERWTRTIQKHRRASSPLLDAAITWLQANAPDNDEPCLVHGDFKTNNLMFDEHTGTVVLDWEMAHIGDPVEDLAWTMLWRTRDDLVGGLLSEAEYLAVYTAASGREIAPQRHFFWEMFSLVKLAAIFIAGVTPDSEASSPRPMLVMLGRALPWIDSRLARLLQRTVGARAAA